MRREQKILLIDDNLQRRHDLAVVLNFLGESHLAFSADALGQISDAIAKEQVLCMLLPADQGKEITNVLALIAQADKSLPILVLGTEFSVSWSSEVQRRVLATLVEPLTYSALLDALHKVQVYRGLHTQVRAKGLQRDLKPFRSLVGNSDCIQVIRQMMQQVADTEASVLILGESGTGKEVVARNLHDHSKRHAAPFVPVNCGAIPAELLESELFGHEKGAFTGAITTRAGRFELANGGTLFLDEIGDMPLPMQVKLLRVLQERTFERVGSNRTQNVDVRIIAATHKNLEKMIEQGSFREDLYYRLNVFPIEMPPLRDRVDDIPLLVNELVSRMEREQRGSVRFSSAAATALCQYTWPGNVRELANLVERMAIMYPGGIVGVSELPKKFRQSDMDERDDLMAVFDEFEEERALLDAPLELIDESAPGRLPEEGLDLKEYLSHLEQSLIQQALDDCGGVVARAAERLRVRRTTLVEKMRKYGMSRKDELSYLSD